MIEFKWSKVDKKNNNTPIIKDVEIDELAEMLLKDYKPQLLKEPTPINHLHFLESYLGEQRCRALTYTLIEKTDISCYY